MNNLHTKYIPNTLKLVNNILTKNTK